MEHFTGNAAAPQLLHHAVSKVAFDGTHVEKNNFCTGLYLRRKQIQLFENIIDPVNSKADADARYTRYVKQARQVIISAAPTNTTHLNFLRCFHFENGAGIIIQTTRQGEVYFKRDIACELNYGFDFENTFCPDRDVSEQQPDLLQFFFVTTGNG